MSLNVDEGAQQPLEMGVASANCCYLGHSGPVDSTQNC